MNRVIVHIDRLVLRGFDRADREEIAEGLRSQLGRVLSESDAAGGLSNSRHVARIRLGNVRFSEAGNAAEIGAQLAAGIVRGFRK